MKVIITFDQLESKVVYKCVKVVEDIDNLFTVKVLMLKGEKGDPGDPTDAQVQNAVDIWLEAHPEATTTVQDGSITDAKFASDTKITNAQIDALFS